MNELQKRLEIFFMCLPPKTKAIYRSEVDCLYIGINRLYTQSLIDLIEDRDYRIMKAPA